MESNVEGGAVSFWRSRRALLASAAAIVVILLLWRPGADRLRSRLEQSLGSALGHKVEIGSVSLRVLPTPGFDLSQFTVRDDAQFSSEPVLRADEVSATLHPSSLWRWRIEIATLSFKDASLNLVRRADGRWNLEPILERAARVPAAPTGTRGSEERPRVPYIEVSNGRVNLKLGAEKTPFALMNADLALWLESNDEWGIRLRGQPVRTDMRLSDTGSVRANGTWRRADDLRKTPLRLAATYEGAQLGQLTKLLYGTDKGFRGTVNATANFSGSAGDLQIQSEASVENFRRYDLVPETSLRLTGTCTGRFNNWPRQLSEILCTTPAQDGSMLLRGKIGLGRPLTYDLNLNAAKFPAQRLVEVLRGVKKGLPQDFSAGGTVNADLNFAADGFGPAEWSGSGKTDSLVLRSAALRPSGTQASAGDALALGSVPFRAMWSAVRQSAKRKLALDAGDIDFPLGNSVVVGPATVNLGTGTAKDDGANVDRGSFRAWFSPSAYCASFSGEGPIQRLLQMARAAGFTAVQPPLAGETKFEWHAAGSWSGFAPPVTKGSIQLRNVRAEFPGLNAPVEIAYGEVSLTPDLVKVDKLSATTGGIHWTGAVTRPRICPAPAACPTVVDLHADEISLEKLNSLLNPNIQKRPWYRILTGTGQVRSALRTLNVTGSLKADRLVVGDLGVTAGAAKIKLEDGHLRFSEFRGALLGGKHVGEWQADFTKDTPEYAGTGALESVALPQLGKLMHSNWITGSTNATYDIHFAGWSGADLLGSVHGTITLDARDGSLARFGPGTNALAFHHLSSTLTAGKSLVVISSGKLENSQGIYEGSGVASFAHQLDLRFVRDGGHGFAITGTLENPHVEALSGEKPVVAKSEKTSERTR